MSWRKRALAASIVAGWLGLIGIGVAVAVRESTTPGPAGAAPRVWPAQSAIARGRPGASRLVIFLHPQCPCSRASLHELAQIVEAVGARVDVAIVFERPDAAPADWLDTDRVALARSIPGAAVVIDDGAEMARFGALTSGHVVMYDPSGRLAFAGGITGSRGHEGNNRGREQVIELAQRAVVGADAGEADAGEAVAHPVYGCGLGGGER